MKMNSVGDMASVFQNSRHNARLKDTLARLSQELTTGITSNKATAVSGDFAPLASLENSLSSISAFKAATNEAALLFSTMQSALGRVQDDVSSLSTSLLSAGSSATAQMIDTASNDALQRFESAVSALNTRIAGKSLFAGRATDQPALASSETMLADIQTAVAAETTVAGLVAAVDAWFDDTGGGFETSGYTGSANQMSPLRVSEGQTTSVDLKADDPSIRDALKGMALAALVQKGTFAGNIAAQAEILHEAGTRMLEVDTNLAGVRARVGLAEGQVETAAVRNDSEATALEIARSDMLSVDPYKAATELQETQTQLETLYTITARLSQLSLADYI